MILPTYKRLYTADFDKDSQKLIEQIQFPINGAFESLFNLAVNNINFRQNIACTVTSLSVTVDSNGIPTKTTSYPLTLNTAIDGTLVISAVCSTNSGIYPTATPFITGSKNQTNYYINHISGLPANTPFNLVIITFQN